MSAQSNYQPRLMKVSMFGDAATGKTSLVAKFAKGESTVGYTATVGVDFSVKRMTVDEVDMKLQIWGLGHCTQTAHG